MNISSLSIESNPITAPKSIFYGGALRSVGNKATSGDPGSSHLLPLHHRTAALFCANSVASSSSSAVAAEQARNGLSRIGSLSQVSGVLGSQWGDEGKGKLVDILAKHFDI
ncbi:adenylosuccinate synthase, partial [Sarracenia purpurea var. burkii]